MTGVTQISIENQYYEICKQVNNNMCHSFTDKKNRPIKIL